MPKSIVFPDKYGMERRKRRAKFKDETKKIDVVELFKKCTPEQQAKLRAHLQKQGIKV